MFVKQMSIFLEDEKILIMNQVFTIYDSNNDGVVTLMDLCHAAAFIPCNTQLGAEIEQIMQEYLDQVVLVRTRRIIKCIEK